MRLTAHVVSAALKDHRKRQLEERLAAGSLWRENALVLAATIGTPDDVGNLTYRSFRPLLERAGLARIRFHDLRLTCATILLGKGTHPKIVQEMMGHATITQTMDTTPTSCPTCRTARSPPCRRRSRSIYYAVLVYQLV